MNRALQEFVRDHLNFLTSSDFDRKTYKKYRKDYFITKHKKKFGLPNQKQVCEAVLVTLRKGGVPPDQIRSHVSGFPLFDLLGGSVREALISSLEQKKYDSAFDSETLETIKKSSVYDAVKKAKEREIEAHLKTRMQEIKGQIEEKQKVYEAFPSVLDSAPLEEPEFDPKIELTKPWWERFYLRGNPFPQKDGLSTIDQDLYEEIVVKTQPFRETLSVLEQDKDYLFNTAFLLLGDFGFGKTTFMDYLSYYLVRLEVVPVRITCAKPFPDASGFIDNFYVRLHSALRKELQLLDPGDSTKFAHDDIEGEILECARKISKRRYGLLVFMDDYHKHRSAFDQIYEFLGTLQVLKDDLTRAHLKVGFIVSGLSNWQEELHQNPQMQGFFDSGGILMPEITPESVVEVFNQRIKAYCYDQSPRQLRPSFVKGIFQEIGSQSGYRDYLNFITSELEHNNFAIVDSPVQIKSTELDSIKAEIERDRVVAASLNKLTYESRFKRFTSEQVAKCLELLVHVTLQDGISETDNLFSDNAFYFKHLRDSRLLQKRKGTKLRSPEVHNLRTQHQEKGAVFEWVTHSLFSKKIDEISDIFNRPISDYLLKIYAGKKGVERVEKIHFSQGHTSGELHALLAREEVDITDAVRENLTQALQLFDSIALSPHSKKLQLVEKAWDSFRFLSNAFFEIDGSNALFSQAGITSLHERWRLHWYNEEGLLEFLERYKQWQRTQDRLQAEYVIKHISDTFPLMAKYLKTIIEDICCPEAGVSFLDNLTRLRDREREIFLGIKKQYFSADPVKHFAYVQAVTDCIEEQLRTFFYATTVVAFGLSDYFTHVPDNAAREYAQKNLASRPQYSAFESCYDGLTRPQFRNICRSGGNIKDIIIHALNLPWREKDWEVFFDIFVEENIATAHKLKNTFSVQDRSRYYQYSRMAKELLSHINQLVANLITRHTLLVQMDEKDQWDSYLFRFAFRLNPKEKLPANRVMSEDKRILYKQKRLADHVLERESLGKVRSCVLSKLASNSCYAEDLTDLQYLFNHYGVSFPDLICSLSYLTYVTRECEVRPWFGSSVLVKSPAAQR